MDSGQILPSPQILAAKRDFTVAQLKLIRRAVARACTESEFDEFIAVAVQTGLEPLRRQITPLILQPDSPSRRMIPWTTIDGLRILAARQGDYRPMERTPIIEVDPERENPMTNPLGIVRAEVVAWKADRDRWHPVADEAWWDEYAPIRKNANTFGETTNNANIAFMDAASAGDGKAGGELDPRWRRMGRMMIAKCAEAQALRRGWPDVLSGLYGEEELHAVRTADQTASEVLRAAESAALARLRPTRTLWFIMEPAGGFAPLPVGCIAQKLSAFYEHAESASQIRGFIEANRASLQTFWEWAPSEAMVAKQACEQRLRELEQRAQSTELEREGAHE